MLIKISKAEPDPKKIKMHNHIIKRIAILLLLVVNTLRADTIDLTSKEGKSITIEIISVTEGKIDFKRENDAKKFTISIDQLDNASIEKVNKWVKAQEMMPTEDKSLKITQNGSINYSFIVDFKLPKYEFGFLNRNSQYIYLFDVVDSNNKTDKGSLTIQPYVDNKRDSVDEISSLLDERFAKSKTSFTIDDKQNVEKVNSLNKYAISAGKFNGFYINHYYSRYARTYMVTDGKVFFQILLEEAMPHAVINFDNIDDIISTITVKSFVSSE
jgi:hypothetical protein